MSTTTALPVATTETDSAPQMRAILTAAVCLCALLAVFWHAGQSAALRWDSDPASSHGWLVPLAVAWLAWRRWKSSRDTIPDRVATRTVAIGIASVVGGVLVHLYFLPALSPASTLFPAGLAFVVAVFGLILVVAGSDVGRIYMPAFLLLLFMVPLPFALQQPIAESLQLTVAWTSEMSLWLLGQPVYREGYILHLPDSVLEVASGCSGLGQFMVFVAIGAFCGVYSSSARQGIILVLLALPVSVVANTLQITLTGLIYIYLGAAWAEGALHEAEGLVTALIGASLLFSAGGLLGRWSSGTSELAESDEKPEVGESPAPKSDRSCGLGIGSRAGLVLATLLPAIVLACTIRHTVDEFRRPPVALARPLAETPKNLASGSDRTFQSNVSIFSTATSI